MKLAISNIAWPSEADSEVLATLQAHRVSAVEIAPTRIWPNWQVQQAEAIALREDLLAQGLSCSSLQAIVYGQPDLKLFGTVAEKKALVNHLKFVVDIAVALGAGPLVFGAPKNRDKGDRDQQTAFKEAVDIFSEVGDYYAQRGACLCIEPNPPAYSCNFITNSQSGVELVRAVNSPGFRLHLDAAGMYLAEEDIPQSIRAAADVLEHFHISEPNLGDFANPQVPHRQVAQALQDIGWNKWVSIEMRATQQPVSSVQQALTTVQELYAL